MKILIVTQYFWPENFKINDLAISLKERGNDVTVLTGRPNYPDGKLFAGYNFFNKRTEYYSGIKIVRSHIVTRGKYSGARLFINYLSFAFFASVTAIFRLSKKAEIIFVYEPSPVTVGIPAIVYKLFSKAPMFFWIQDLWPESVIAAGNMNSKLILKITAGLVKLIYKKSDIIFISSRSFRNSVISKGVSDKKIIYLPNWAEDLYGESVTRNEDVIKMLPSKGFKIMFAGNIGESQDFESIVRAAELTKEVEDIHWIILGDGRKKTWVEQEINSKKLKNIYLLGRYPIDKMPYFFREADVLLVSLKDEAIFSLTVPAKIQSYLACGKPILAMINGEGAEIIKESNSGFAVNAGDYNKLHEKVLELYKMPKSQLDLMAKSSREYYINYFDRKEVIDKLITVFRSESLTKDFQST
jgi:glycosyltransferase involved in cell wall biosynthesis